MNSAEHPSINTALVVLIQAYQVLTLCCTRYCTIGLDSCRSEMRKLHATIFHIIISYSYKYELLRVTTLSRVPSLFAIMNGFAFFYMNNNLVTALFSRLLRSALVNQLLKDAKSTSTCSSREKKAKACLMYVDTTRR